MSDFIPAMLLSLYQNFFDGQVYTLCLDGMLCNYLNVLIMKGKFMTFANIIDSIKEGGKNLVLLVKWLFIAIIVGVVVGGVSTLFAHIMEFVTDYRNHNTWLILLLPIGGLVIAGLYKIASNENNDRGTNMILSSILSNEQVPYRMAPMIIISTIISHLFGASVGREGAALQLGGSLGSLIGKVIRLDDADKKVVIMCGMSAAFAALFGTPMAAAIFALEVIHVGVMYYVALVPCIFSALIASQFAAGMGIHPEAFTILAIPKLTPISAVQCVILSVICAVVSIIFCMMLHGYGHFFKKYFKNIFVRVLVGSVVIVLLTIILQTSDYMGAGIGVIDRAISGEVVPTAFIFKMIFTALAIGCGFKGGEIVPSFFVGATLGCLVGKIIGFEPSTAAAVCMVGMFCCVTNCPITSILIAFELFGYKAVPFFLICNAVGYMMSGYFGLYSDQLINSSKYKIGLSINAKKEK